MNSMSEWKEYKLEEITEPVKDTYLPTGSDNLHYVGLEHIEQESLRLNGIGKSTDVTSNKFLFKKSDILFGKLRPYFRKVVRTKFEGICSTDIWVFRAKKGFDQNYLFYFIANWDFVNLANGAEGGTRMPRADWNFLKTTDWSFPPLPEQKSIASILSSLDDKIDLLHRQNATLEAMAETLFRQWFLPAPELRQAGVEEGKEEWEEGCLGDVIEIFDHLRVPLSKMERDEKKAGDLYPYYGAAQIMDYINDYIFDGEYILLGEDGTVRTDEGYPVLQYATGKFWVNNHTHVIKAKSPYNNFFIQNYLRKKNIDEIITGAVQPKINQGNLKSLYFPKFPKELVEEFSNLTDSYFEKINQNKKQIKSLTALRDTLLPKLMSGEVRSEQDF